MSIYIDKTSIDSVKKPCPGWIEDTQKSIIVHSRVFKKGEIGHPAHSHPRAQLLWSDNGIMRVKVPSAHLLVPSSHAVWVPGNMTHEIIADTDLSTCFIFVEQGIAQTFSQQCVVLQMNTFMRHLLMRFLQLSEQNLSASRMQNMASVVIDELTLLPEASLALPAGFDLRLQRVTSHLLTNYDDSRSLLDIAGSVGAGIRTLERLFKNETGLTFSQWRTRLRLITAIQLLNDGHSSTEIALTLGYHSPSAFIAAFKKHFSIPPQAYLKKYS